MAEERIVVKLVLDTSGYKKGAQEASSATDKVTGGATRTNKAFGKLKGTLGGVGPAIVGAVAGAAIIRGVSSAIQRAEALGSAYAITEQIIKQTGGSANVTAEQIKNLSAEQAILTGIDKELIAQSNNILLTFKNLRNEVGAGNDLFDQASGLVLDLATTLGTDAKSGAIQLGKALNDPLTGITALTRSGITFNEVQKEQIKGFAAAGDIASAQKIILAELESQLGGTAVAAADTTAKIGNVFKEIQEQIGTVLLEALEGVTPEIMDMTEAFGEILISLGPVFEVLGDLAGITLPLVAQGFEGIGIAVTAVTSIWDKGSRAALDYKIVQESVNKALKEGTDPAVAFANGIAELARKGTLTAEAFTDLAGETEFASGQFIAATEALLLQARAEGVVGESLRVLEDQLLSQIEASEVYADQTDELIDKYGLQDAAARKAAGGVEATGDALDGATGQVDEYGNAIDDATEATDDFRSATDKARDAHKRFLDQLAGSVNAALGAANSIRDLQDAQDRLHELQDEGAEGTDEFRLAQLELAAQIFETEQVLREFDGGNVGDSVNGIATALGISQEAARMLLDELGLLDGLRVESVIDLTVNRSGFNAAQRALSEQFGSINTATGFGGFRAHGGPVTAGEAFIVGERGPEVFIPTTGGQIIANNPPATSTTGGGFRDIIINNPEHVTDDITAGVQRATLLAGLARSAEVAR